MGDTCETVMHAIIMGAGEGTRMWPISTMVNKHLLKLGGIPVIRIIVERLLHSGHFNLDDITIVCLKKDLKDYEWEFRDLVINDEGSVNFHVIEENKGTANEFHDAAVFLKDDDVLLHYGDTITDLNYTELINTWTSNQFKTAMIAVTKNIRHDYSQVVISDGIVQEMVEKPFLSFPSWTGIGIFNTKYFVGIYYKLPQYSSGEDSDFGYDVLPAMAKDKKLYGYQYDGKWFDVGNLRSYQKLQKEYQNKDLNL